jgi:hypothetical protein
MHESMYSLFGPVCATHSPHLMRHICGLCLTCSTVNHNRSERLESRDDVQRRSVANQRLSISLCYLFVATLLHRTSSTNRVRRVTLPPALPLGTNRTPQHMQHSSKTAGETKVGTD